MSKAIGMVEYKTVSAGILAADTIVKTAEIEIIEAQTVCPGKYIILFSGTISAVKASLDAASVKFPEQLIDSFMLGNPSEKIFPAIYGTSEVKNKKALGVLETFSAPAIIVAADEAVKAANVELIEIRLARGMCGKSYVFMTGEISAVEASIAKAKKSVEKNGMYLDSSIVANPDEKLWQTIY